MSEPDTTGERPFVWPATYYSSAASPRVLPAWAPYGCGAAAVLILVVVFVGGAWLSSGGFLQFMDLALGMSVGEMKGMFAADVPASRKESLDHEIEAMRKSLREERLALPGMKPFFESLNEAISDRKVTNAEASKLEQTAKRANASARPR